MAQRRSILDGISLQALQQRLNLLQQAYLDLSTGSKGESLSYTQGDGAKAVTYTRANLGDLTQAILTVQKQIDVLTGQSINRRIPMRPVF